MKTRNPFLSLPVATFLAVAMTSCQHQSRDNADGRLSESITTEIADELETPLPSLPYVVVYDEDTDRLHIAKDTDFDQAGLSIDALTQALVSNYPEVPLTVERLSGDTLYAKIADAQYLTQQMGSTGAQTYLLEVTYAYTELANIRAVNFAFEEGDHATPGTYTRDRFKGEVVVR